MDSIQQQRRRNRRPAKTPAIELVDAKEAYDLVLAKAGCWPRDRMTKRTIDEVTTKTGAWGRNAPLEPTDEWFLEGLTPGKAPADTDGDGMPDAWEKMHGLDSNDPGRRHQDRADRKIEQRPPPGLFLH